MEEDAQREMNMDEEKAGEDFIQRMWDYVATLEAANNSLVDTLRESVKVLEQFTESVPDPDSWDDLIELFKQTLEAGERTVQEKIVH